mmetsp:Transcript_43792/g.93743  ORF Transcript_43792/g.93743 Transcript_43792/m.93743 type:complete len:224 (+) Transcript_43792:176-847(+)|eukprot:CAMPEP_0206459044 /NCGR_PEP_ID=MMETSP0324_2-20121206/23940_1 /ASSEMBLY_ACC=CAM_ASM_000836 /TAXON_ID=2866 /ORGANISM="Crypthecodinium cohnii, Strain Seligo" /LENGTH=223 /DNA_ID=CAMNT_0053930517 /DNA_START=127 /DNA_END=798 /DNA_ORIENTATION=+
MGRSSFLCSFASLFLLAPLGTHAVSVDPSAQRAQTGTLQGALTEDGHKIMRSEGWEGHNHAEELLEETVLKALEHEPDEHLPPHLTEAETEELVKAVLERLEHVDFADHEHADVAVMLSKAILDLAPSRFQSQLQGQDQLIPSAANLPYLVQDALYGTTGIGETQYDYPFACNCGSDSKCMNDVMSTSCIARPGTIGAAYSSKALSMGLAVSIFLVLLATFFG